MGFSSGPLWMTPMKPSRQTSTWVWSDFHYFSVIFPQAVSILNSVFYISFSSLVGVLSNNCSRGWTGASPRSCMLLLTWSFYVSVAAQNKGAGSTYNIGKYRWKPTSWYSFSVYFGLRKATNLISSKPNQIRMQESVGSTFLSYYGSSASSALRIQSKRWWISYTIYVASLGVSFFTCVFIPIQ